MTLHCRCQFPTELLKFGRHFDWMIHHIPHITEKDSKMIIKINSILRDDHTVNTQGKLKILNFWPNCGLLHNLTHRKHYHDRMVCIYMFSDKRQPRQTVRTTISVLNSRLLYWLPNWWNDNVMLTASYLFQFNFFSNNRESILPLNSWKSVCEFSIQFANWNW